MQEKRYFSTAVDNKLREDLERMKKIVVDSDHPPECPRRREDKNLYATAFIAIFSPTPSCPRKKNNQKIPNKVTVMFTNLGSNLSNSRSLPELSTNPLQDQSAVKLKVSSNK
ncbi:unnamed protein product [Caenorhabditis brenneri]